jgi:hypothetical protein
MEGRHVGLDFYDLLIEALIGLSPAPPALRKCFCLKNSQNTFQFAKHSKLANRMGLSIISVYTP